MTENRSRKQGLITTLAEVERIAAILAREPFVAVDTEFIRETTFFPQIALIQMATETESWLFDPTALSKDQLAPLLAVLRDPAVTKVIHAAFADQECFYWEYGVLAEPVLDTAVAAALCGLGDNAGLGKLLREVLGINVPKGRARAKWLARPLPEELLSYAHEDVSHLVALGKAMKSRLEKNARYEWALEESAHSPSDFDPSAEEMALKMGKSFHTETGHVPVLVELVRWREERARKADLPRNWVADNETLIALAKVKPRSISDLRSFRGLHPKEIDRQGEAIVAAILRGLEQKTSGPAPHRPAQLTELEEHVVDFIQTYVKFLAAKHEIAPRYLLGSNRASRLLQNRGKGSEGWVKDQILSSRAASLVGAELEALLAGKRALGLQEGRVQIVPVVGA